MSAYYYCMVYRFFFFFITFRNNSENVQCRTRNCDVYLADGYVAVEVKRDVLHRRVLERVERQFKALRFHLESSDATAVVYRHGFGHVNRFYSVRSPTYHDRLSRTVLEHRGLVVCREFMYRSLF